MPRQTTESDRSLAGRIGAHSMHARNNSRETSRPGREAFLGSFELAADPEGTLDPQERARRAEHLKKAHFTRMALASAKKRRRS